MVGFSDRAVTHQAAAPNANPDAVRLGQVLGNVTFIERPFHPTTLVSVVAPPSEAGVASTRPAPFFRISPKAKACCRPR